MLTKNDRWVLDSVAGAKDEWDGYIPHGSAESRSAASPISSAAFGGQSCHAFRKAFVSELRRAGAPDDAVEYLVGHSAGVRAHYLDADALGLRGVVGVVAPVGAGREETVVPLRRTKWEGS